MGIEVSPLAKGNRTKQIGYTKLMRDIKHLIVAILYNNPTTLEDIQNTVQEIKGNQVTFNDIDTALFDLVVAKSVSYKEEQNEDTLYSLTNGIPRNDYEQISYIITEILLKEM